MHMANKASHGGVASDCCGDGDLTDAVFNVVRAHAVAHQRTHVFIHSHRACHFQVFDSGAADITERSGVIETRAG